MQILSLPHKNKLSVLALGAESAGIFSIFHKNKLYFSDDFGDLLIDVNFKRFGDKLNKFLRQEKIKPDVILTDLHPLYKTTLLGQRLTKKYKAQHIQVQHHIAHIFSCVGENMSISNFQFPVSKQIQNSKFKIQNSTIGIALDGTGYGLDGKIWGGEIFRLQIADFRLKIERIGHLENQTVIGGDLAVKEPARMLIAILDKTYDSLSLRAKRGNPVVCATKPEIATVVSRRNSLAMTRDNKDFIYKYVKKFYTRNQFEVLYNQLQSGFNCQKTSSTGRVLDAVSILLGFCGNERNFKHEPTILLEKNSTIPYSDLKPRIIKHIDRKSGNLSYELSTTHLLSYLLRSLSSRDKRRLAATAQLYIAEGLHKIIKIHTTLYKIHSTYLAGGIANNKIISDYLISKGALINQKIPRGDAGISFGQIIYYLTNTWH